jgi:hypothetical protein
MYPVQAITQLERTNLLETNTSSVREPGIAYIPVPTVALPEVFRAIAAILQKPARSSMADGVLPTGTAPEKEEEEIGARLLPMDPDPSLSWRKDEILDLKGDRLNATSRALLDLCAEGEGMWVSFEDVFGRAGRTHGQARAELAGFTKLVHRRFSPEKKWPVEWEVGAGGDRQLYYRMSAKMAAWWREA